MAQIDKDGFRGLQDNMKRRDVYRVEIGGGGGGEEQAMVNLFPKVMTGNILHLTRVRKEAALGTQRVTMKVNHKHTTRLHKNYNGPELRER